ncbi:MAG TPA: branched-chain amino acid ABC transporter ATP-binding protein/permease [Solirubrobacterales bacterium]|jgi:branched-chain amino acid transport system permease protein|nr:branched-chain amino acid ABC transporter ATP-binding protein/permease [Solirubrobacterales bacterium]
MNGRRLRSPASAAISLVVPLVLVALTAVVGASGTPSFEGTVTLILCNLVIVLGLQVFIGNSGVYSFGQLGLAAGGGYVAALLTIPAAFTALQAPDLPKLIADAQLGPVPSTLIAAAACGLLALVVGWPLMRTSTLAIPISTFAFLIVVYNVLANWDPVTGGSSGLISIPRTTDVTSAGLWAGAAVVVALAFKWSASGYRLQATREDEVAARSIGIGLMRERLLAFTISGMLCGVGGALAVHQSGVLSPTTFYFAASVTTITMLVVGGARSVFGAVIGTVAVATVNELLRNVEEGAHVLGPFSLGETPGLAAIGLGLILLVTMIALPEGLSRGREAGELEPIRRRLRLRAPATSPATAADQPRPRSARGSSGGLRAEGVSLAFSGLQVLRGVDLELPPGEALGLIGPNGAGKTTLVNVLSGFQTPDSGSVLLDGVDATGWSPARLARAGLGRTFQAALPFAGLTVIESVAVGAMGVGVGRRRAVGAAADVLERLGLGEQAQSPAGLQPPGNQRLLGIARALATGPRHLLLDEPAAGLNDEERRELVAILRGVIEDFGCAILLIEHDMNVVMDLCSRVQVLDDGETVVVGSPEEVQAHPAVVEAYLGTSYAAGAHA